MDLPHSAHISVSVSAALDSRSCSRLNDITGAGSSTPTAVSALFCLSFPCPAPLSVYVRMGDAAEEPALVQALAVGLAKSSRYACLSPSFQRCSLSPWIKENIKKKECCYYVEDGRYVSIAVGTCLCAFE